MTKYKIRNDGVLEVKGMGKFTSADLTPEVIDRLRERAPFVFNRSVIEVDEKTSAPKKKDDKE